ncbi:restriction endonuclease [Pectobacterium brasiliense]|nr:restriction endonuclease [Pectobacterium brasiliense]QSD21931.1 restriction endonuclease [Pectobacterium brasiliense]
MRNMIKKPKDLESYVQFVYSSLLNLRDKGVLVSSNTIIVGKSNAKHEIDVYYQFENSGVIHKVAFECKFKNRKVEKSDVVNFHGKLQDIGNIQGVFVSKEGYQSGAIDYANHYDIKLLTIDDLPSLNIIVANRLKSVALPDESYVGEPFWALMGFSDGKLQGDYWSIKENLRNTIIPLFISKNDAINFLKKTQDKDKFVVRGLPQHSLNFFLKSTLIAKGHVKLSVMLYGMDNEEKWPGTILTPEEVGTRFLHSDYLSVDNKLEV